MQARVLYREKGWHLRPNPPPLLPDAIRRPLSFFEQGEAHLIEAVEAIATGPDDDARREAVEVLRRRAQRIRPHVPEPVYFEADTPTACPNCGELIEE